MPRTLPKHATAEDMKYVQDTLYVISGKWKMMIILAICAGNNRFKEIQRAIPDITPRMLSKELKELEQNKLVVRKVYDESPVLIEYGTTPYCKSFGAIIHEMIRWGKEHRKIIKR
ncbi:winged helix-turn-helix transcriptional regulator [Parachryseolinea silvisoli]|jgi:DNA-binding HxlR family transcriptional regulator|uniref:winged helix-turn-helix transcriptional regulator n=1 Tax=Parachryseolinea silvisoli TaxID=2873601 RepID=UPI0022658530|nr:helix-turn-helix domain-containing protein [Parachryseolinea silvisoli]MCD9015576.1 helix-turn-helix transcriptional regulator [Parachryseolinea silvisoli]